MTNNSHQKRGLVRPFILPSLLLVTTIFVVIVWLAWNARFTVASGEKSDDLGYYDYGYQVDQYYLFNSFKITFWTSRGMEFVYGSGQMTVDEIVEQRWLDDDAAIYLNLRITHHDSIVSTDTARIIFDFHRGEMYETSGFTLWRMFDKRHDGHGWMSDGDFDAVLRRLEPKGSYPAAWFAAIKDPNKPDWEILPQEARPGEVILSKRNELGILSNFAATPFELDGERYASVEGFWQAMLYPEICPDCEPDPRLISKKVTWKYYRFQVEKMTGFDAKAAGTLAEENMAKLGIDWCSFEGKRFPYRSATGGEHYRLIVAAMRAKLSQNPEVERILLATGDLILKPDHHEEENAPPEWHYYDIWMQLRSELQKSTH